VLGCRILSFWFGLVLLLSLFFVLFWGCFLGCGGVGGFIFLGGWLRVFKGFSRRAFRGFLGVFLRRVLGVCFVTEVFIYWSFIYE
jgi:hypothetical protein